MEQILDIPNTPTGEIVPNKKMESTLWDKMQNMHECRIVIYPGETAGFVAYAERLPEAMTQGDNIDEVLENMADVFRQVVQYYRDRDREIPWVEEPEDRPAGNIMRTIMVEMDG